MLYPPHPSVLILALESAGAPPVAGIIEIHGPESSGKTTIALHCAEAQKAGEATQLLSMLNMRSDPVCMQKPLGVDADTRLYLSRHSEQALEILEAPQRRH